MALRAVSAEVDLTTGTITAREGGYVRDPPAEASLVLQGLTENLAETAIGHTTELSDPEGQKARFDGEISHAWRSGDFVLAIVAMPDRRWDCVAFTLGGEEVHRLPASWQSPLAGSAHVAACALEGLVHVFRWEGTTVRSVSLATPPSYGGEGPDVFVTDARICVLSGGYLLLIEADELAFDGAHTALPMRYEALAGAGGSDPDPGEAVVVLPESILVDHPRFKRLRLPRDSNAPAIAKGDPIFIDDIREGLPGILHVHAWHKAGEEPTVRPAPPPLELDPPAVALAPEPSFASPPSLHAPVASSGARVLDSERLDDLASRHGFVASELLLKLLRVRESDGVFRRWLDKLGWDIIEVRALARDWDTDPNLLAVCRLANGDEFALYIYPPWCKEGNEPPVVEALHETNFVEFKARTFEAFFDRELQRRVDEEAADTELVRMIRERLEFPMAARDAGEPPPWLPVESVPPSTPAAPRAGGGLFASIKNLFAKSSAPNGPVEAALAIEKHGNVLEAERALLRLYLLRHELAPRAALELRRIYRSLDWNFAFENIESSIRR
ncbi:hypothetical protein [Pendulispora albinea]|uniref:Uncharacterized protein n=1 Tax=Pendulispora albinea TaxID=2741071 RepID=A0ABZ2M4E1_9BACT